MAAQQPGQGGGSRARAWGILGVALLALVVTVAALDGAESRDPAGAAPGGAATRTTPTAVPAPESKPAPTPAPAPPSAPRAGEPAPPPERPAVPFTRSSAPVAGVVFSIDKLQAVKGIAQGPGEVGGPSLRFELTVRNDTAKAVSLTSTVVNVYFGPDEAPATELRKPGGIPLPETVAPGRTARGVFIFAVPEESRDQVRITADYTAGVPIAVFEGQAPR